MHLLKDHVYKQKEVVIGGNLNAFVYAYEKGCYIIPNTLDCPFAYDPSSSLHDLGIKTSDSLSAWELMAYTLAAKGLNPFVNKVKHIRVNEDEKLLTVNIGTPNLVRVSYDNLRLFDIENISGLSFTPKEEILGYRVFDWFDVRSGMKHNMNFIEDEDSDFVKKIHFFLSERIDGNYDKKDLVSESFLTEDQLQDVDYSDSISRLKTIIMMKESGIKGKKNGLGSNVSIKIELWKREIKKLKNIKTFQKDDIIVDGRSLEEVINEFSSCRNSTVSRSSA